MRKGLLSILSIVAVAVAAALSTAPAGGQAEGDRGTVDFEVHKDVHGDGPTSGFVVEYECTEGEGGAVLVSGTLNFDNIVDGDETQVVEDIETEDYAVCTIEEVDANGADLVEYECEVFFDAASSPDAEGDLPTCSDNQTATHLHPGAFASFLVRNTFEPEVLPDDEEPPPAVDPDVVTATPSFTG